MTGLRRRKARRTLKTRLVLVTIALTAAVSLVIGLVSVISLRMFLEGRLDAQLTSAVRRSRVAVDRPVNAPSVPPLLAADRNRPGFGPGPGFLLAPGQSQGTIGAMVDKYGIVRAGALDSTGALAGLSSPQRSRLATVPADGSPHTIDLGGTLGSYRVLAQASPRGERIITGLPLSGVQAAVYQLIAAVVAVGVLGLLAVALAG